MPLRQSMRLGAYLVKQKVKEKAGGALEEEVILWD